MHEWFQRFEICCKGNGWNEVLKLPVLVEGEALAEAGDYVTAKEKLSGTMMPMAFVALN